MRPSQLLASVLAVTSLSAAFSLDSLDDIEAVGKIEDVLFRRQNNNNNNNNNNNQDEQSQSDPPAQNTETPADAATTGGDRPQETGNNEQSQSATGDQPQETGTGRPSRTQTGDESSITDNPEFFGDPVGGVQMNTPAAISGPQYYRIGDWVTFGWNYTSLSVTPSNIDILATCTANQATYTLAVNQTVEESGIVLWDTKEYQATGTVPLLTETYTLIIYDSKGSMSDTPKGGYLAAGNALTFGMYSPQPYVDFDAASFRCPTCNSGSMLSASERQTLGFLFGMATITVLSFTWFGTGFGLF